MPKAVDDEEEDEEEDDEVVPSIPINGIVFALATVERRLELRTTALPLYMYRRTWTKRGD